MKYSGLFLLVLLSACSKHKDPGFTSAAGKWSYTTSDAEVGVTFDLVKNSTGGLDIQNPTIKINGVSYLAVATISGVTLPAIEKIHINANDPKATYAYDLEFDNCSVSTDFKTINVTSGFYTWPYNSTHTLTSIKLVRI